jgi:carbamoyltransferase
MNSLATVRPGVDILPEGFVLPGNFVRLQVVQQQANPLLWRLLKRFGEQAPGPMLVNTSFNLFGEPLVIAPRDAVRSYFCSGMDALVVDNFVLSKTPAKIFPNLTNFLPIHQRNILFPEAGPTHESPV